MSTAIGMNANNAVGGFIDTRETQEFKKMAESQDGLFSKFAGALDQMVNLPPGDPKLAQFEEILRNPNYGPATSQANTNAPRNPLPVDEAAMLVDPDSDRTVSMITAFYNVLLQFVYSISVAFPECDKTRMRYEQLLAMNDIMFMKEKVMDAYHGFMEPHYDMLESLLEVQDPRVRFERMQPLLNYGPDSFLCTIDFREKWFDIWDDIDNQNTLLEFIFKMNCLAQLTRTIPRLMRLQLERRAVQAVEDPDSVNVVGVAWELFYSITDEQNFLIKNVKSFISTKTCTRMIDDPQCKQQMTKWGIDIKKLVGLLSADPAQQLISKYEAAGSGTFPTTSTTAPAAAAASAHSFPQVPVEKAHKKKVNRRKNF